MNFDHEGIDCIIFFIISHHGLELCSFFDLGLQYLCYSCVCTTNIAVEIVPIFVVESLHKLSSITNFRFMVRRVFCFT